MEKKRVSNEIIEFRENMACGAGFLEVLKATEEGIQNVEKSGQSQLIQSSQIPRMFMGGKKEDLEAMGVKFLGETPGDDLFYDVELPEGWTKKKHDGGNDYWTELRNEKEEVIAMIFYKAAFYDRKAHIRVERREK